MGTADQHAVEIQRNRLLWEKKPLLRKIYRCFHETIAKEITHRPAGLVVELGSGIADIREVIPGCIRTDISENPTVNREENAYALSFADGIVSTLILFDVFHHLRYPGTALKEFQRVLVPGGHVIIFEPDPSLLGRLVYGLLHPEPLALNKPIEWNQPTNPKAVRPDYYAAQGNAYRIFVRREVDVTAPGWMAIKVNRICSLSYVLSGGYSKPQLYPTWALPVMRGLDAVLSILPAIFSTRLLVVLEKPPFHDS